MPRIRTIKPEFPQSESMGRVSRDARLTFVQLWTLADDSGRLRGSSRMLASLLFPYDDDAPGLIDGWLEELALEGCIERYRVGSDTYLAIANWLSHQKIDKPSPSKNPAPNEGSRILANPREHSSLDQGSRIKDQGPGEDQGPRKPRAVRESAPKPAEQEEFADAWAMYPKRPGNSRADALKAWNARIKAGADVADLLAGVARYAAFVKAQQTEPRFVKQAATFFGPGEHYLADWTPPKPGAGRAPTRDEERARIAAQINGEISHAANDHRDYIDIEASFVGEG